jgi:hypothetical protein
MRTVAGFNVKRFHRRSGFTINIDFENIEIGTCEPDSTDPDTLFIFIEDPERFSDGARCCKYGIKMQAVFSKPERCIRTGKQSVFATGYEYNAENKQPQESPHESKISQATGIGKF